MDDRIKIRSVEVLSDDWAVLKKTTLDYRRSDGVWETQIRQTYDRGDGAVILPYDRARGTILLVKQFRYPAYVTGHREPLIEACAGLLDKDDPETCIRREAEDRSAAHYLPAMRVAAGARRADQVARAVQDQRRGGVRAVAPARECVQDDEAAVRRQLEQRAAAVVIGTAMRVHLAVSGRRAVEIGAVARHA